MKDTKATMFQHLKAKHTCNGNPCRVYVLMNASGDIVRAIDEGYSGEPKECAGLVELPSYVIYNSTYHALLWEFGE